MILGYLGWGLSYLCLLKFGYCDKSCYMPGQISKPAVCCSFRLAPGWWIVNYSIGKGSRQHSKWQRLNLWHVSTSATHWPRWRQKLKCDVLPLLLLYSGLEIGQTNCLSIFTFGQPFIIVGRTFLSVGLPHTRRHKFNRICYTQRKLMLAWSWTLCSVRSDCWSCLSLFVLD